MLCWKRQPRCCERENASIQASAEAVEALAALGYSAAEALKADKADRKWGAYDRGLLKQALKLM